MDEGTFLERLKTDLPSLSKQQCKALIDEAAAYHAETEWPVIQALICDDAPQFNWLTYVMMLCWVREGRPIKS